MTLVSLSQKDFEAVARAGNPSLSGNAIATLWRLFRDRPNTIEQLSGESLQRTHGFDITGFVSGLKEVDGVRGVLEELVEAGRYLGREPTLRELCAATCVLVEVKEYPTFKAVGYLIFKRKVDEFHNVEGEDDIQVVSIGSSAETIVSRPE